jgi:hypothetical protein
MAHSVAQLQCQRFDAEQVIEFEIGQRKENAKNRGIVSSEKNTNSRLKNAHRDFSGLRCLPK